MRISSVNVTGNTTVINISVDLVISTEEILNGKLHFLCSEMLTLMLLSVRIYMIGIYDRNII